MAPGNQDFSTLEAVDPDNEHFREQKSLSTLDLGKQVVPEEGKFVIEYNDGLEATPNQRFPSEQKFPLRPPRYEKQRNCTLICGVVLLIVILATVLGGVLGSRKSIASSSLNSTSNSLPSSNDVALHRQRAVSAVSFSSDDVNNTRVYLQDDLGNILEAASSADNTTWETTSLGVTGMNRSALAAAVSRPDFDLEISIFYTDSNYRIHDIIYTSGTGIWAPGTISSMNYVTHPSSTLSAMYNQCQLCANTRIMAYQDVNGFIQIANQSSAGWTLTQLNLGPIIGTGLALHPFFRLDYEDQINLFYQKSTLNTSLASWLPAGLNNGILAWKGDEQVYNMAPPETPLAAASAYTNLSTGFNTWIQVLQLSGQGIEVSTWSGAINDWLEYYYHPSLMSNSSINGKNYGAIAVTAIGSAFAVVGEPGNETIQSWQVNSDLLDWTAMGTVDIGDSWI